MRRHAPALFLLSALLLACAGQVARDKALLPALAGTWSHLRPHVEAELQHAPDANASAQVVLATDALAAGDPTQIAAVDWALLEGLADKHVDRLLATSQVGPHGAGVLRARITEFGEHRRTFLRQP